MQLNLRISLLCFFLGACPEILAQDWESSVGPVAPGSFAELKPLRLQYVFGWNGVTAASAELRFTKSDGRYHLEGSGGTSGMARTLWKFDGKQTALIDAHTLRPIQVRETEAGRSKTSETEVIFTPTGATSRCDEHRGSNVKTKERSFEFPHLMSMSSALLYLRSQSLSDGAVQRLVVYPATSAYLCTVKVVGREKLTVPSGSYDAIKLDLQLAKIGKNRELKPHKKFKHATAWLSNDADRLLLRIEAQIFIGTVFTELQSVQFENKP